jgi:hypothetical protein
VGQERVLLGPREAVDLVDEQHACGGRIDRGRMAASATASRTSLTPASTADRVTRCARIASAISRARVVFPVPGGPHNNSDGTVPAGGELAQELAGAQQVLLAGELRQRSRAHALGEGLSDAARRGVLGQRDPRR